MTALFTSDGAFFVPSEHTRGPWDAHAQHAGPPAALLGRALERLPSDSPMHMARVTMEVLRPVPLLPLRVDAGIQRSGRSTQLLGATLTTQDGVECAQAVAVRIRVTDVDLPDGVTSPPTLLGPDSATPHQPFGDVPAFHETGVELRFERGAFAASGPAAVWIRLRHPVVDDEQPTPLQRVLAAADFGNGVSAPLDWQRYLFINPDLTVYSSRPCSGEWVCLDASSQLERLGTGVAYSRLHDTVGPLGHALQSLLVDRRQG